jgi:hypothetical protein
MALQPFGPRPLFQILNPIHSRQDSLDGGSARRKVATYTQNKRTQASMPLVGFEPTTPVFERAKTVHVLDPAATLAGAHLIIVTKKSSTYTTIMTLMPFLLIVDC